MEKKITTKRKVKLVIYLIIASIPLLIFAHLLPITPPFTLANHGTTQTLWQYQCIDTMKTSRDKARIWKDQPNLHANLQKQIQIIKSLGANCVAIDTPYDQEFIPYLTSWVTAAHNAGLHVWFRGNFSSWEGWFDYSKNMTNEELLTKAKEFILTNQSLFANGDVFTPAPEAENGGQFNQVAPSHYQEYRQFLIDEYTMSGQAFNTIGKHVIVNWLSMNGGFARRMLNQQTVDGIGNTVTIDHYINDPSEMSDYIKYFANNFHASVVIGEFGAPIPEINGSMTEDQQADFVDKLLWEVYKNRASVFGINYWVLYDSSTAILNEDGSERKVANVIRKYYEPLVITGTVTDNSGNPLPNVTVETQDLTAKGATDKDGKYTLIVPNENTLVSYTKPNYLQQRKTISQNFGPNQKTNITLISSLHESFWNKIEDLFFKIKI